VAAIKAVLVNRVGDFFLLYAIALIYSKYNTLIIQDLASVTVLNNYNNINSDIIATSMFIAVMSKSAQFGLHS
jgi:NADH:ubiquinone oxidoreductase subunit 5 (subunit L)/multisubunit Na+/H+ antiporter MnhA subunit